LGTIPSVTTDCTLIATIIGSAFAPGDWEMQVGTVETIAVNNGTIAAGFNATASVPVTTFMPVNTTGYFTGVLTGTGGWTIRSGPDTVGGVPQIGSGLLVASGANTHTGNITMQTGTKLQLGLDCTNTQTWAKGSVTIAEGAVLTQFASMPDPTAVAVNLNNDGTYNLTGCGACGVGGKYTITGVTNNGVINLDKVYWRNTSTWGGTGFVNVKNGATLGLSTQAPSAGTTVNLNGCGWKAAGCVEQGALNMTAPSNTNYGFKLKIQSASCIKSNTSSGGSFSGVLSGSAPLLVTTLNATKPNGSTSFTNTANTYFGTMTVDGTTLAQDNGNSLQFAKIVLTGGGRITSSLTQTIGSLASSDPTSSWLIGGSTNVFIKNNGITQFDGSLSMTGSIANVWLEGGATNQLTLTKTGQTATVYARNGSKLIMQGGTLTGTQGQIRVSNGSTVSAGTLSTGGAVLIYIDATSALDVYAQGGSTAKINTGPGTSLLSAGWKVNLKSPLSAGTHGIWNNTGAAITQLPVIGENLSGRTVTGFVWNNAATPKTLSVILA
jgi:hypothetical protein